MNTAYGIGLDIGIASVGWAVVALNEDVEPYGLIRCGSRVFDKAEQVTALLPHAERHAAHAAGCVGAAYGRRIYMP